MQVMNVVNRSSDTICLSVSPPWQGCSTLFESFNVNANSGIPVWIQIRNYLLYLIRSGVVNSGDVLPTVRELAVQLGVNYNTIHKVYRDLEADGLICSSRGKRSFVADIDPSLMEASSPHLDALVEEIAQVALDMGIPKDSVIARIERQFKQ